jgi:hypothetical protein
MPPTTVLPANQDELVAELCRSFGVKELPDYVWGDISRSPWVPKPFRRMSQAEVDGCIAMGRAIMKAQSAQSRGSRPTRKKKDRPATRSLLSQHDIARALYQSRRLADLAREEHEVVRTQKDFFDGHKLTAAEAVGLLESVAARLLPRDALTLNEVPLIGHAARICQPDGSRRASYNEDTVFRIEWSGGGLREIPYLPYERAHSCHCRNGLTATYDGQTPHWIDVWPGSLLDELGKISAILSQRYPWSEQAALWFLLTDQAPQLDPVLVKSRCWYGTRGTFASITMVIEPSVSESTVRKIYRDTQRRLFKTPRKSPESTSLDLVQFVDKKRSKSTSPLEWDQLRRNWRTEKQSERYGGSDSIRRAYGRAMDWIIKEIWFPTYKLLAANATRERKPGPDKAPIKPSRRAKQRKKSSVHR